MSGQGLPPNLGMPTLWARTRALPPWGCLLGAAQGSEQANIPLAQLPVLTVKASAMVFLGQGNPSISKRMAERILSGEYIDFAELLTAKMKQKQVTSTAEGKIYYALKKPPRWRNVGKK